MAIRPRVNTDEIDFESVSYFGTVTAPGAGVAIAGGTPTDPGLYKIRVECCHAGGTPAAAEDSNFRVQRDGVVLKRMATTRVAGQQYTAELNVRLSGAQAISVFTQGAGTASVVYQASITATKIGD